jgi:hypothetical protein
VPNETSFIGIFQAIRTEFVASGMAILLRNITEGEQAQNAENGFRGLTGPWFAHLHGEDRDAMGRPLPSFQAEAETPEGALGGVLMQAREWAEKQEKPDA